jgi:hypothetical protein
MAIDTGPPNDSYDNNIEYLIDTLPEFMANDESSGNWKLLAPIGYQIDAFENDLVSVSRATSVQEADSIAQLNKLAKMVGASHRTGEEKEHFRSRLFARFQLNTAEGTIGDVIHSVSTILDVDPEAIGYQDLDTEATVGVVMPRSAIRSLNLSSDEVADILNDLVPAGYEVAGQTRGTFVYVSPTTYNNVTDWAEYNGYDGLDANDDPKGNGGTYAGIVN